MLGRKVFGSAWIYDDYWGLTKWIKSPDEVSAIDVLVLWGGEDISPSYYNQAPIHTDAPPIPSLRDHAETLLVREAVRLEKPILAICRGAQLVCALHGGSLWQHVHNHAGPNHEIKVKSQKGSYTGMSNSAHHQMMRPDGDAEILGWCPVIRSPAKYGQEKKPEQTKEVEVEIAWFPKFRALGVQGHPEWQEKTMFLPQITKLLFEEKTHETFAWY